MKQRLNNGLLMHVKNLIMNDPDVVKVTSKQTAFCSTHYTNDNLGNLSRGICLAWCTMSPSPSPPALVTSMFACYFMLCAVVCRYYPNVNFQKQAQPNWEFFFFPQQTIGNEASNANRISGPFFPLIILVINEFLTFFKAFQIKLCRYDDMLWRYNQLF